MYALRLSRIDADMQGKRTSFIHLTTFLEHLPDLLLKPRLLRLHRKMICADPTAALDAEYPDEDSRKSPEQLVAFRETVPRVIELHAAEIHVQQRGIIPLFPDGLFAGFRQLKEISHAREAGQIVIIAGPQNALLMDGVAKRLAQLPSSLVSLLTVDPFIGIPDLGKADACIHVHMLSVRMDDTIPRPVCIPQTVYRLKPASVLHKEIHSVSEPSNIIRMDVPEGVMVHGGVYLLTIHGAHQGAETSGNDYGNDPLLNELEHGKGYVHTLHEGLFFFRKAVSFHKRYSSSPDYVSFLFVFLQHSRCVKGRRIRTVISMFCYTGLFRF